jgi:hypothetical protein
MSLVLPAAKIRWKSEGERIKKEEGLEKSQPVRQGLLQRLNGLRGLLDGLGRSDGDDSLADPRSQSRYPQARRTLPDQF